MTIPPNLIAELRELESKATKGPFVASIYDVNEPEEGEERKHPPGFHASLSLGNGRCALFGSWHEEAKSVAMKLNLFPLLLRLVEVQGEELKHVQDECEIKRTGNYGYHSAQDDIESEKWRALSAATDSATAELVKAWEEYKQ